MRTRSQAKRPGSRILVGSESFSAKSAIFPCLSSNPDEAPPAARIRSSLEGTHPQPPSAQQAGIEIRYPPTRSRHPGSVLSAPRDDFPRPRGATGGSSLLTADRSWGRDLAQDGGGCRSGSTRRRHGRRVRIIRSPLALQQRHPAAVRADDGPGVGRLLAGVPALPRPSAQEFEARQPSLRSLARASSYSCASRSTRWATGRTASMPATP